MHPDAIGRLSAKIGSRYRIERELGGGGMSRVFVATETALGREVCIKVLAEELTIGGSAERFAREIAMAARLQQANIVPVLAAGDADGLAYYTMPFVRGESLRSRMASDTLPPMTERIGILRDVARALAYAHSEGIVHRDIKPENVLLSHGTAMVTDFGIAKAISASRTEAPAGAATLTQAGSTIGTPAYMAPEQAVGDAVDHRTDLYAWGVMAYELLTGSHPFQRHGTHQQIVTAHLTEQPAAFRPSDGVPLVVSQVVMRCLEKDPARRPASAAELLVALDASSTPLTATASAVVSRRPRLELVVVIVVLVAALAVWLLRSRGGGSPVAPAAEQSLAVLPLANLSGDPADDYFGIGLAEEITRAVVKTGLRVIGRVSAGALQAKGLDELAIARELKVQSILSGTVQRANGQVRISVSLLSAEDGSVRWSERYDRPLANVFAVQDEIANTVAGTLRGTLGRRVSREAETNDPEAHAMVLQGMVLFNRRGEGPLRQAIALFQQASARDPKYARAQASLAMAQAVLPAYLEDSAAILTPAIEAADRAIALDSTIAESHTALGYAYSLLGDLRKADQSFRRALTLDSTVATTWGWYSLLKGRVGQYRMAHEYLARVMELEPASLISRTWRAQILYLERRFAEADSSAGVGIAMDSTHTLAWVWRANALLGMGHATEAVSLLKESLPKRWTHPGTGGLLAYALAVAGRPREARAVIDSIRTAAGGTLPASGATAAALEELGDHDGAVALLTRAIAWHDPWVVQFPRSVRYDKLRRDPRIEVMLTRLGTMPAGQ